MFIKEQKKASRKPFFVDDYALVAHTESDLQLMLNRFSKTSKLFGLSISLARLRCSTSQHQTQIQLCRPLSLMANKFTKVEQFKYLGSTISHDGVLDREIGARVSKASQALGRL